MEERYIAAMLLSGAGDAIGYKNGSWEFCFNGTAIQKELKELGGLAGLDVRPPKWLVSDDTVLHLATAEGLCGRKYDTRQQYFAEVATRYKKTMASDMIGRAPGATTCNACHLLRPLCEGGWRIPFNPRGGGCGAAMRSMCIGLRYPDVNDANCLAELIAYSIETGRMTHHHPTGFLGGLASALFTALSLGNVVLGDWGRELLSLMPQVRTYLEKEAWHATENLQAMDYFIEHWQSYLSQRGLLDDGATVPKFPQSYGIKERDVFYKSLSFNGWGGASGHDAPMIAYDALLACDGNWEKLCRHGMLHGGDSDSTGAIAACWFGARYGSSDVPDRNYTRVEYHERLTSAGKLLHELASNDKYLKS